MNLMTARSTPYLRLDQRKSPPKAGRRGPPSLPVAPPSTPLTLITRSALILSVKPGRRFLPCPPQEDCSWARRRAASRMEPLPHAVAGETNSTSTRGFHPSPNLNGPPLATCSSLEMTLAGQHVYYMPSHSATARSRCCFGGFVFCGGGAGRGVAGGGRWW